MRRCPRFHLTSDARPAPVVVRSIANAVRDRPVNERLETLGDAWLNYYAGFVVFQARYNRFFLR